MRTTFRLTILCAAIFLAGWSGRLFGADQQPTCTIGPHKVPIRWVGYKEAHGMAVGFMALPFVGRIPYPLPGLDVDPDDDPRIVAGYLVVDCNFVVFKSEWEGELSVAAAHDPKKRRICPVVYARTQRLRSEKLHADEELIAVKRPFDATKLPAIYEGSELKIGPHRFSCSIQQVDGYQIVVKPKSIRSLGETASFSYSHPGYERGGPMSFLSLHPVISPSGDVSVDGALTLTIRGKSTTYTLNEKLKRRTIKSR